MDAGVDQRCIQRAVPGPECLFLSDLLYAESGELFVVTVSAATLACVTSNLLLLLMLTSTPGIAYSMFAGLLPHLLSNAFAASLVTLLPVFSSPQEVL
jgi:rod shape-determining protein MreD